MVGIVTEERREYLRNYQREWIARRREAWFKENGPCRSCGSWENLELDHIDRATKIHHAVWSWSEERREAELKKCQPLCRTCHLEKTIRESSAPPPHGSASRYKSRKYRCRCDLCRIAKNKSEQDRRRLKAAAEKTVVID